MYLYIFIGIGDFTVGWLSERLKSRKKTLFLFYGITILFTILYFFQGGGTASSFYLICMGLGFGVGFNVVYLTMGVEQFGTNLRASASISITNMVRGFTPLLLLCFVQLRLFTGYLTAAWIIGIVVMLVSVSALYFTKESFGKELDFIEE